MPKFIDLTARLKEGMIQNHYNHPRALLLRTLFLRIIIHEASREFDTMRGLAIIFLHTNLYLWYRDFQSFLGGRRGLEERGEVEKEFLDA